MITLLLRRGFMSTIWLKRSLFLAVTASSLIKSSVKCDSEHAKIDGLLQKLKPVREPTSTLIAEVCRLLRRHLLLTLAAAGSAVLAAIASILSPIFISRVIDLVFEYTKRGGGLPYRLFGGNLAACMGAFAANAVLTFLYIKLVGMLGEVVAKEKRVELFSHFLHETVSVLEGESVSELMTRLNADVQSFKHSLKQILTTGIKSTVQLSANVIQMAFISSPLTLSLGSALPLIFMIGNQYGTYLRRLSSASRELERFAFDSAHEALSNIRVVKSFSAEDSEVSRFHEALNGFEASQNVLIEQIGIFQGLTSISFTAMLTSILYFGGMEMSKGVLSGGQLMSFLLNMQGAQRSLNQLVTLAAKWTGLHVAFGKIWTPRDDLEDGKDAFERLESLKGEIEFSKVSFAYEGRPGFVLSEADLKIEENQVVGLIGESGSGKSTVTALLERFFDLKQGESGSILVDGCDHRRLNLKWLRKQIGLVPQEPILFNRTIRENIAYGAVSDAISENEIEEAAKAAQIHDFIVHLPDGYDTQISNCTLSGGQKQRISIARALLKRPKILILDEATSALDPESEAAILRTLKSIAVGRTVIVITHKHHQLKGLADAVFTIRCGKFERLK